MRFSLKSSAGAKLFVASKYDDEIIWSTRAEDACSFSCISRALKMALEIRKETGEMPQVISTYF
tara:strand:- start:270 stop:461 length:192 start_codon:yes stop_codon:yes gene_type:complete